MDVDPWFADAENDDYHLMSETGRYDPSTGTWVTDAVSSPCINSGDPSSDWSQEPEPNGQRVNMGAYGGTKQASKGAAFPLIVKSTPIIGVAVTSTPPGAGGATNYSIPVAAGAEVQLTVPESLPGGALGWHFLKWVLDGTPQATDQVDLTVTMDGPHTALAEYSDYARKMYLNDGWNLVAVGGQPVEPSRDAVFPAEICIAVWQYDTSGGYAVPDVITLDHGYWVLATQDTTLIIPLEEP